MSINISQRAGWATELSATTTGSIQFLGQLTQSPVQLILDNQNTTNSVQLYVNGTAPANLWHTFAPSEAIVLDMRANHGIAPNFTADSGTSFYINGTSGSFFSISYTYAQNM